MSPYVFIGAGAVGSALGGLLVRQGTDVLLAPGSIDAEQLRAHVAPTIRSPGSTSSSPPPATGSGARLGPHDAEERRDTR